MDHSRPQAVSLREHALAIIRDAIIAGELAEDRIYSAAGLAKQLGMSLSPVREAMMALVTEGTVEAVPNRGFRLVPITADDLEEIIRIRVLLAVPAVRRLCEAVAEAGGRGGARDAEGDDGDGRNVEGKSVDGRDAEGAGIDVGTALELLRDHAAATVAAAEAGDVVEFYTHDRRFHEALLEFGLGRRAAEISLRLRDQSRLFNVRSEIDDIAVDSAKELPVIVDLIEAGKADEVAELVTGNLYFFKRGGSSDASSGEESIR
ncbi:MULTISPECIES: GntR family transcriptional regulator [unclassified Brevibacterium]|uniref:GntR family transcriptional regulator n=1 Tax=unclassified Brevibacterium TaxID=2614124 RepID=UPI001E4F596F|nr:MULTISPECIES: GntR family transcriptional regulator [unclassified Brevibacterium]MDK8433863.1 GntR family transcriptional regulator [Brevibacterium sp. H-BE7]